MFTYYETCFYIRLCVSSYVSESDVDIHCDVTYYYTVVKPTLDCAPSLQFCLSFQLRSMASLKECRFADKVSVVVVYEVQITCITLLHMLVQGA